MSRTGQIFALSLALAAPLGAVAEEIVTVSGRPGATQSYLLLYDAPPPAAVAVLFPGGERLVVGYADGLDSFPRSPTRAIIRGVIDATRPGRGGSPASLRPYCDPSVVVAAGGGSSCWLARSIFAIDCKSFQPIAPLSCT